MRTGIKILVLAHRYLGLVLSALFLIWFLLGFVMNIPFSKKNLQHERA
jgi:hypothetical protein